MHSGICGADVVVAVVVVVVHMLMADGLEGIYCCIRRMRCKLDMKCCRIEI